jgi:hypothetical protein
MQMTVDCAETTVSVARRQLAREAMTGYGLIGSRMSCAGLPGSPESASTTRLRDTGARDAALKDMTESARELGAEGVVVGIDFDYEVLGEANGMMMMVAVSDTAVETG